MKLFSPWRTALAVCLCAAAQLHGAGDTFAFAGLPSNGNETAVLVLCPGTNADGANFLKEAPWVEFAQNHKLGLVTLRYTSDPEKLHGAERQGYYWPDQGSGQALLDEIKRKYGKDLPILIFGFSGGAQFTGRFIEWAPDRILAWAAYSAQFWDKPSEKMTRARGIVACGDLDGLRWHPSFSFFYAGRELGLPWVWISRPQTGHARSGKLEEFIRMFFEEELLAIGRGGREGGDFFADLTTKKILSREEVEFAPAMAVVFRSRKLMERWAEIHEP